MPQVIPALQDMRTSALEKGGLLLQGGGWMGLVISCSFQGNGEELERYRRKIRTSRSIRRKVKANKNRVQTPIEPVVSDVIFGMTDKGRPQGFLFPVREVQRRNMEG